MTKREAYLSELRANMIPGTVNTVPGLPHVVKTVQMPPYQFQSSPTGSGKIASHKWFCSAQAGPAESCHICGTKPPRAS